MVPRKFTEDCLIPSKCREIQLRILPGSKTWDVHLNPRKQQYTLTKGWADFVLNNNLDVHDYCVMELAQANTRKDKTLLDVYIYRVVE